MQHVVDYLIIGQGIAGSLLAHRLMMNNHRFMVIDSDKVNASKVASGMYNPVVLQRFTPVWQAYQQISQVKSIFAEIENSLNSTLDYHCDIYRLFHNQQESQKWQEKFQHPELTRFLNPRVLFSEQAGIIAPFGAGQVLGAGRIDLTKFLGLFRQRLLDLGCLQHQEFDYLGLKINNKGFDYQNIKAKKIIFCEGYELKQNPYFNNLPLYGNKGETIVVHAPKLNLQVAVKSKVFLMPLNSSGSDYPENSYLVGATYNWDDKDSIPSQAARDELSAKLKTFLNTDYEIIKQSAGMRPTVIDRKPLLGVHPTIANMYVLNGLGTRGVMLGCTMAEKLYQFIENKKELDNEINITRFY